MAELERIPYADPQAVAALPAEAKALLGLFRGRIRKSEYKTLENDVVRLAQGEQKPVMTEKAVYGGKLSIYTEAFGELGVYNPEEIPYDVLEKMSHDPTIALGLSVIRTTPLGLNWRIESDNPVQRALVEKVIGKIYKATTWALTDAVRMGFACAQKCWDVEEMKIYSREGKTKKTVLDEEIYYLDKVKFMHPKSIRMRVDRKGNFLGVTQYNPYPNSVTTAFRRINKNELVLYSHNMEYGNWFGETRLKNCYPAWYWSMVLMQFMLKYYERRGQPLTLVRAPPGTRTDNAGLQVSNIDHALKVGQGAISNSVVALPSDLHKETNLYQWTYEVVKDDQRGEMFIDALKHMDSLKLRGLFVPDKMGLAADSSPHSASGSSAGDTLDVFIMTEQALINDLEEVFNSQIIPDVLRYNFPKEQIEDAFLKIEKLDYNKKLLMKDVFLRMIMLAGSGVRDGRNPKFLPSFRKLAAILDLPMDQFGDIFDEMAVPPDAAVTPGQPGDSTQKTRGPTLEKKAAQDANNTNRGTSRKERSTKERSAREKR